MDAVVSLSFDPIEAISMDQSGPAEGDWFFPRLKRAEFSLATP
jgi:hypothetical protein